MKKLTARKLDTLRKAIDNWAKEWELGNAYIIYVNGKQYARGESCGKVNAGDYCEGWDENLILGMAFDGHVYEAIHMAEDYYASANQEFRKLFEKCGLEFDFYDSTHLTAYSMDEGW